MWYLTNVVISFIMSKLNRLYIIFIHMNIYIIALKNIRIVECASPTDISNYRGDNNVYKLYGYY